MPSCTFSNILGQKWRGLHDNMTNGVQGKDFNFFCLKSTYSEILRKIGRSKLRQHYHPTHFTGSLFLVVPINFPFLVTKQ